MGRLNCLRRKFGQGAFAGRCPLFGTLISGPLHLGADEFSRIRPIGEMNLSTKLLLLALLMFYERIPHWSESRACRWLVELIKRGSGSSGAKWDRLSGRRGILIQMRPASARTLAGSRGPGKATRIGFGHWLRPLYDPWAQSSTSWAH